MRWLLALALIPLVTWFVVLGIAAAFQRALIDRESPFRLSEFHHAYIGIELVLFGFALNSVTGCMVQSLGLIIIADDVLQHHMQTINDKYQYLSPLHNFFATYLWPLPWIPPVVAFADRWWFLAVALQLLVIWLV